jgi:uncharacterized membrane protein
MPQRREHGAISLVAAAALVTAIMAAALAVDLGNQVWSRQQLQTIVDLAALDAVRSSGECVADGGDVVGAAAESARRNGLSSDVDARLTILSVGEVSSVDGIRQFEAIVDPAAANAVRVEGVRRLPVTLVARPFLSGDTTMRAVAVARQRAAASLRTGARGGRVDVAGAALTDALFESLLGTSPDLSASEYQALVDATIPLGLLVDAPPALSTAEALLATETSFADFLERLAGALELHGADAAGPVRRLRARLSPAAPPIVLGRLISVGKDIEKEAREARLSVFDLVMWGALLANGDRLITVDPVPALPPELARAKLIARVGEPPRIAIGPPGVDRDGEIRTEVRSPALRMEIELEAAARVALLEDAVLRVQVVLDLRPAVSQLAEIRCARFGEPVHRVTLAARGGGGRIGIGHFASFDDAPTPSTVLSVPPAAGVAVAVLAAADVAVDDVEDTVLLEGPFPPQIEEPSESNSRRVGSELDDAVSSALASAAREARLTLVGDLAEGVQREVLLDEVAEIVRAAVGAAPAAVVTPVLTTLGATIGGQDVTVSMVKGRAPELVR